MSAALSAAKKRRAPIAVDPPKLSSIQQQPQQSQQQAGGLTLQQVIALIDKRLINLETAEVNENDNTTELEDMSEEYENRFDILAQEISELKQTVLSLQTYTMEVNKMLFDERMAKQITNDL